MARRNESIIQSECATCSSDGNDSQGIVDSDVRSRDEVVSGGRGTSDGTEEGGDRAGCRRSSCSSSSSVVVAVVAPAELKFKWPAATQLVGLVKGISGAKLDEMGAASGSNDDDGPAVAAVVAPDGAGELVVALGLESSSSWSSSPASASEATVTTAANRGVGATSRGTGRLVDPVGFVTVAVAVGVAVALSVAVVTVIPVGALSLVVSEGLAERGKVAPDSDSGDPVGAVLVAGPGRSSGLNAGLGVRLSTGDDDKAEEVPRLLVNFSTNAREYTVPGA